MKFVRVKCTRLNLEDGVPKWINEKDAWAAAERWIKRIGEKQ